MKNKVKLFLNPDPRELGEEINQFLEKKGVKRLEDRIRPGLWWDLRHVQRPAHL